ncbi:MAG: Tetraheme cytochrome c subunit of nitrate or reductase [Myxococcaceae bacterium]|nr:Tetraheme cytochrome c subunit of nitrate or reductase [Myxococcaceae bacterium]
MSRLNSILRKLAHPRDRELLDRSPTRVTRMRVLGRIGLRFWWAYLAVLCVLSLGTVSAGADVYHRTEQSDFCGACHEMGTNFGSWSESRHKNITCADCHSRPGAFGWAQAKTAGVKQLWVHFTANTIEGIKAEPHQFGIINANCRRCHEGLARVEERLGLGVSHRQHLNKGMDCITCHTAAFAHPKKKDVPDAGTAEATAQAQKASLDPRFVEVGECFKCHDGKTVTDGTPTFSAKDEKNCLKCHPDADQSFAHGARHASAAKRKPCLDCHDAVENQVHFAVGAIPQMCEKCHEKQAHESRHSPYKKGECDKCHRVMSPAYLFKNAARPTNTMCLTCHEDLAKLLAAKTEPSPPGPFSEGEADLHRGHLKLEEASDDWCFSCHAPHGSDAEWAMIRIRQQPDFKKPGTFKLSDNGGTCEGGCHSEKSVIWSGH